MSVLIIPLLAKYPKKGDNLSDFIINYLEGYFYLYKFYLNCNLKVFVRPVLETGLDKLTNHGLKREKKC